MVNQDWEAASFEDLGSSARGLSADEAWSRIHVDFESWHQRIDSVARPVFDRVNPRPHPPEFNSSEWWACMIYL